MDDMKNNIEKLREDVTSNAKEASDKVNFCILWLFMWCLFVTFQYCSFTDWCNILLFAVEYI